MGMDFNIKPVGGPASSMVVQPAGPAAHDSVATQLPASQTVTAADIGARLRNDTHDANSGTSHQIVFDRDAATMVYQVVDNRTSIVVRQFPDEAMLRRRAYFRAMDMTKSGPGRDPATDRTA